ncbi:SH3 and multiple ankyrin repeat domains protein 1 [Amia ocellicauda]|uniref:SH3 and multiple ankyrin repeat domains protein 1 n=1 Tax=Amia ocellicauda TaxID=2972642 RepID=UPI003463DC7A
MTMPLSPLSSDEEQQSMLGRYREEEVEDEEEEIEEESEGGRERGQGEGEEGDNLGRRRARGGGGGGGGAETGSEGSEEEEEEEGEEEEEEEEEEGGDEEVDGDQGREGEGLHGSQPGGRRREGPGMIGRLAPTVAGGNRVPSNPGHYSKHNPSHGHNTNTNPAGQGSGPNSSSSSMAGRGRLRERSHSSAPPPADAQINMMVFRIGIPDIKQTKCLRFNPDASVWCAKRQVLCSLTESLQDVLNYGLFQPASDGRHAMFLQEERLLRDYPQSFERGVPYLEFRYKTRVYKQTNLDEKQLAKLHTKASLKKFIDYVHSGSVEKMAKFLDKGLDPNFHDNDSGETPLSLAVQCDSGVGGLRVLCLGGAHIDFRSRDGLTPLHKAVRAHNHPALLALLELGASPNYKDRRGLTPLYHSVMLGGDTSCCESLLFHRAALGVTDENGWEETHQIRGEEECGMLEIHEVLIPPSLHPPFLHPYILTIKPSQPLSLPPISRLVRMAMPSTWSTCFSMGQIPVPRMHQEILPCTSVPCTTRRTVPGFCCTGELIRKQRITMDRPPFRWL